MTQQYLYIFSWQLDEYDFSRLEMRAFFGRNVADNVLVSPVEIQPSRSPFMRERIEIMFSAPTIEEIAEQAATLDLGEKTFKITSFNNTDYSVQPHLSRKERGALLVTIGMAISAEADMKNADIEYGLVYYEGQYYFGEVMHGEAVWLHHMHKPEMYSTALNTRTARAVANIAAPQPDGLRVIDPCCGIGTVLVEAMSMGIAIEGRDMNKRVVWGSRINLRHFGYEPNVEIGPIEEAGEGYDVAIIDMPYNLFTHISKELQQSIITHARRIAKRAVIVTIETMDDMVAEAGFTIVDRGVARKGSFERQVLVCE